MISREQIRELSVKWQTSELNVAREFIQHVLLSALFGGPGPEAGLTFKGGTALRLLEASPRFSEDLDFDGRGKEYHVGRWIEAAVSEASRAGLDLRLPESCATSGGWFAVVETQVHDWKVSVEWNVSLREGGAAARTVLVSSPLWTPYSVRAAPADRLVEGKVSALLDRAKPRDFFDLYYILRRGIGDRRRIAARRAKVLERLEGMSPRGVQQELKQFLPKSHWRLLRDLKDQLKRELERL